MNPPDTKSAPAPVPPAHDPKTAKPVTCYRHKATGRTVGLHQPAGDNTHLFSATGVYIVTAKKAEAEQLAAEAKAAKAKADAALKAANDREVKLAAMPPAEREAFLAAEAAAAEATN